MCPKSGCFGGGGSAEDEDCTSIMSVFAMKLQPVQLQKGSEGHSEELTITKLEESRQSKEECRMQQKVVLAARNSRQGSQGDFFSDFVSAEFAWC